MMQDELKAFEKFLSTLEWLLAASQRYSSNVQIGLIHIDFGNPRILGEAYGAKRASERLQEVTQCLRKAFRKADLVARDGEDFWILTPYTPLTEKLSDRLTRITQVASKNGLEFVERDISMFSLADVAALGVNRAGSEFLSHLKANHIQLSRANHKLRAAA